MDNNAEKRLTVKKLRILVLAVLVASMAMSAETWRFLPCFHNDVRGVEQASAEGHFHDALPEAFKKLKDDSVLTEEERREAYWHTVEFPHRDFVKIMPEERVFGWYGCEFDLPNILAGMDVLVDLGIIDDSDETFVNGARIGATGRVPNGSAWQTDRLYRISAGCLKPFRNYMAVHVWSLWGLGGIVGPPVLKAAILPSDAQWEVAFVRDRDAPKAGLNSAVMLSEAFSLFPTVKSLEWQKSPMPWRGFANWKGDEHYAIFKVAFNLNVGDEPRRFDSSVVMDMGPVFDVTAVFLNGRRLCLTGRFPEDCAAAFTEAAQRARFIVPPNAWSGDGRNELAVIVYRERGIGGLPSLPGLLLDNPIEAKRPSFAQFSDSYNILLQSGDKKTAEIILKKMRPKGDDESVLLFSHKAHLAFLGWFDGRAKKHKMLDGAVAPVVKILKTLPEQSPKQSLNLSDTSSLHSN